MRYGAMAILGLLLVFGGTAEAARNDQPGARNQARPSTAAARPTAARPSSSQARQVGAGGNTARPASLRPASLRPASLRPASTRPVSTRSVSTDRQHAGRQPTPYRNASLSSAQLRDRSGRLVAMPGYQRAVLRGQSARFSAACTVSRGRRVCGGTRQVAMRWSGGLMPAAGNQTTCPDGTMATLAVGHDNVVRCVPL